MIEYDSLFLHGIIPYDLLEIVGFECGNGNDNEDIVNLVIHHNSNCTGASAFEVNFI